MWRLDNLLKDLRFERVKRFLIPVLLASIVKIVMLGLVQYWMIQQPEKFGWHSWMDMFRGWDGGWYRTIAIYWYDEAPSFVEPVAQRFAFPPLFSGLIRILGSVVGVSVSQVVVSSFFGLACIPLFQLVAEHYLDRREAFSVTVLASLFPLVFLFISIGYSEGLFLTLTLLSWIWFLRDKALFAGVTSALASLARFFGVVMIIPMFLDSVLKRDFKRAVLYILPTFIVQGLWLFYGFLKVGSFSAPFDAEFFWNRKYFATHFFFPAFFGGESPVPYKIIFAEALPAFELAFIALSVLLIVKVYETSDWKLALYSTGILAIVFLKADIGSYIRYVFFIFPVWYIFRFKRWWILIPVIVVFAVLDVISGYLVARWAFMG